MSVLTISAPRLPNHSTAPPVRRRWTVDEFHQLWTDGWFEDSRPMLIDGEIFEMAIPGPLHNKGVGKADYLLKAAFAGPFWVRIQMPLVLDTSDPVPDISVVAGIPDDHDDNPTSALLVVEVADTSLSFDLGEKAYVYAAAGIADYWVVDLNNRQLIVHRDPRPDPASTMGASYATIISMTSGQTASPLAQPTATINVSDLLP
jgi:Uma2 family endonuclease